MNYIARYRWVPRVLKKRLVIYSRYARSLLSGRKFWEADGVKLGFVTPYHHHIAYLESIGGEDMEFEVLKKWVVESRRHSLIYDIGGYNGIYGIAAALANPKSQVVIFEPDAINAQQCRVNIALNNVSGRCTVEEVAISDMDGTTVFDTRGMTGGRLGKGETIIQCKRLDEFPTPDLIKLDIEGKETDVLIHAPETISSKPVIFLELHEWAERKQEMWQVLSGYTADKLDSNHWMLS